MRFVPRVRIAAALLLAGLAGGCMQPLHAPQLGRSSAASAAMAEVAVERIDGFLGYAIKSELDYLLTGGAPARGTRYLLKVKTHQSKASSMVDATTGLAQSATVQVEAVYVLIDQREGGRIRASGKTFASAVFDRSPLRYASLRAERDAEERVGKALAERLRIIVATALARETPAGSPPELSPPDPDAPAREPGDET
jgi:LPS-assembly lipoprotein